MPIYDLNFRFIRVVGVGDVGDDGFATIARRGILELKVSVSSETILFFIRRSILFESASARTLLNAPEFKFVSFGFSAFRILRFRLRSLGTAAIYRR